MAKGRNGRETRRRKTNYEEAMIINQEESEINRSGRARLKTHSSGKNNSIHRLGWLIWDGNKGVPSESFSEFSQIKTFKPCLPTDDNKG